LRAQVEHIAARFPEFTTEHVFARCLDDPEHARTHTRRGRPRSCAACAPSPSRRWTPNSGAPCACSPPAICAHLGAGKPAEPRSGTRLVPLPTATISAVERLVGDRNVSSFIAHAAEREVNARILDGLASSAVRSNEVPESP
jgi:hypothetical protein